MGDLCDGFAGNLRTVDSVFRMRFSICVDPGRSWPDILALVEVAEARGFDRAYVCDHFIPGTAGGDDAPGFMLEGWTIVAALGGCTKRIGLGTLVLGNTYRHPAVVANMAATLVSVTNGRFVLGLGAGWQRNEHTAYGIDLPPPATRLDRLEESCQVIRALLTEEVSSFSGEWYRLTEARCDPKPRSRLPLLIGGGGERRTLRIAARFADEWHVWASPEEFRRKNAVLDQHCADVGRDPATLRRATGGSVCVATKRDADMAAERLVEYRAAGANEFIVRDDHGQPLGEMVKTLSLLSTDVLPRLR
jgi:F420-dependent oxidoreductase-like protein